jgi:polyhydroxyalkanoate synthesis regulator protein
MTRTIRRYGNRKLYSAEESRYITLQYLGDKIREGDELSVTSHATKQDITDETLANIVLAEVHAGRRYDRQKLVDLVRGSQAGVGGVGSGTPTGTPS